MAFGHPYLPGIMMNTLDPITAAPTGLIIGRGVWAFYISQRSTDVHNVGTSGPTQRTKVLIKNHVGSDTKHFPHHQKQTLTNYMKMLIGQSKLY